MNKNTKIWLNYLVGGVISVFLLWHIYRQVANQLAHIDSQTWHQTGPAIYLIICVCLMFFNTSLEGFRWYTLTSSVEASSYGRVFSSYLAGLAISILTPNRVGEYPGRILYLQKGNALRYITISIVSILAQLSSVYIFGLLGLLYYNVVFPSVAAKIALVGCLIVNVFAILLYWRFDWWLALFDKIHWMRRFTTYGRLVNRITTRLQVKVLSISMLRFIVFTAQYLFLLKWMNINMPLAEGFCIAALFFWILAVIPSVALTELGIRGAVAIYLFHQYSDNTAGIIAATAGIWFLNLIIPSIFGSFLLFRMRLLR